MAFTQDRVGPNQLDISKLHPEFNLSSIEGQPFADVNIATDRNRMLQYYYSNGFPSATFRYTMAMRNTDDSTVQLTYQMYGRPARIYPKA